jgi:deoxyribodipyrimidine photolyase-like uncharacterized protein
MTEFCGGCRFDPKKRVGEDACPFTTLYWDFLDRHRAAWGFFRDRRTDLYGALSAPRPTT